MLDFGLSLIYNFFKLMNRHFDVVIIVKPYPNTVLPALLLKSRGAKIIIDIDDLDYGYRNGFLSEIIRRVQEKLVKKADLLTTHNAELMKLIKKEHPEYAGRIYMLNQCVDREVFNSRYTDKANVRKIKQMYKNRKILFYMAHLNVASFLEDILQSLKSLDENALLLVAGGGPLTRDYTSMAHRMKLDGRVIFLGQLAAKEAADYVAAADVCLVYYRDLPVNKYRASMKLREYLAMGKKVAASAVGEIKDFGDYVFLSRPDPKSYAVAINRAIKSIEKKGEKGYKIVIGKYDWKTQIRDFHKFLLGVLK